MAKKKTELDKVVKRAAKLILAQLDTLPIALAKTKLKELQDLAASHRHKA